MNALVEGVEGESYLHSSHSHAGQRTRERASEETADRISNSRLEGGGEEREDCQRSI